MLERSPYQAAVSKGFPGYEILRPKQFHPAFQPNDGESGSLLVGRFNFDKHQDFVAWIVPARTPVSGTAKGKYIECLGTENPGLYLCASENTTFNLPLEDSLVRVGPGVHQCLGLSPGVEWTEVVAEIDSIGTYYSDKGGGFSIRRKGKEEIPCVDSD